MQIVIQCGYGYLSSVMSLKQDLLNANRPTIKVLQPLFRTDEKFLTF